MIVIPSVDILNRKCVQLVQGRKGSEQIVIDDPVKMALYWQDLGAEILHIIDLDGAFEGKRKNIDVVDEIIDKISIPVHLGGGIRSYQDASLLLEKGIDKVILGTSAIRNPELVEKLSKEFGKRVIVALDFKDDSVVIKGWSESYKESPIKLAKKYERLGAWGYLYTDVSVEGTLKGVRLSYIEKFVRSTNLPVIVSGGITSLEDVKNIKRLKAWGIVVGMAFYKGILDFREAKRVAKEE
ncbi:MAG: 1-(5-phosphoribosyl)-5-[(5-phosphoribosylamino)methylideneamino]imidazole-4-carboxamide isomerase [Candidatus Hydrothermarchaeota archaeon]